MNEFVNETLKSHIRLTIDGLFTSLNGKDKEILFSYVIKVIDHIALWFNFDHNNKEKYIIQFTQNNNRDIIAIIKLLLPYIDEKNNLELYHTLTSFDELYVAKEDGKFKFTNIQYSRFFIKDSFYDELDFQTPNNKKRLNYVNNYEDDDLNITDKDIKYDHFKIKYINDNLFLLIETIQEVAGKLYVNWVNIRPVSLLTDIYDHYLYKIIDSVIKKGVSSFPQGLNMSIIMIYNILVNDFYDKIKNVKWFIFEVYDNDKLYTYTELLNNYFPLDNIFNELSWEELDENVKYDYSQKWEQITNMILTPISSNDIVNGLFKSIFLFMVWNYSHIYEYINPLPKKDALREMNVKDILKLFIDNNISVENFYDYLNESYSLFKTTWFKRWLISNDNEIYTYHNRPDKYKLPVIKNKPYTVSLKNIYNFAKALNFSESHHLPLSYNTLPNKNMKEVLNRILNKDKKWFNIQTVIGNTLNINDEKLINDINEELYNEIRNIVPYLIVEQQINKGILSEFIPTPELTDETYFPNNHKEKRQLLTEKMRSIVFNDENKKKYEESIYFLTNDTYKKLNEEWKFSFGKTYFDEICESEWQTYYSLDWISQIGFFHRYKNNRVIFVTGSTGQGKSTQIPKLILYAQKIIDNKQDGKTICTQPRIPPTEENSRTISHQMGVPIQIIDKQTSKYINTKYLQIQFKHQFDKHSNDKIPSYLRIVTDGTLMDELSVNIMLKKVYKDKNGNVIRYFDKNIYDNVIIDEAHEHNTNMDIILSVIRHTLFYNNTIRLFIVSATMDEDEHIYRRYYRNINDNLLYPIPNNHYYRNIDRINVDRRFDITPPNTTTRFKIKEIYSDKIKEDTYEENEKEGIEIVKEICTTTTTGNILFFSIGKKQIIQICNQLNMVLPPNVLCIPFFAEMPSEWKNKIGKINEYLHNIDISRDGVLDIVMNKINEEQVEHVHIGTYTRALIIATNVAEASITIPDLEYVVDCGYVNIVKYDIANNVHIPEKVKITESNRIQRKGRIGRVMDGTIYYTYNKSSRENIKQQYDICLSASLYNNIYKLLEDNRTTEKKPLLEMLYHPETADFILSDGMPKMPTDHPLYSVMKHQFYDALTDNEPYYGDIRNFSYIQNMLLNNILFEDITTTGFSKISIYDNQGIFYIIHPNEPEIVRNEMTGYFTKDSCTKLIDDVIHSRVLNDIKELLFLSFIINKDINSFYIDPTKTLLGINVLKFMQLNETKSLQRTNIFDDILILAMARRLGCIEEMSVILIMLYTLEKITNSTSIRDLMSSTIGKNGKMKYNVKEFKSLYGNDMSELVSILKIYQNFKDSFSYLLMFDEKQYDSELLVTNYTNDIQIYNQIKNDINNKKYNESNIPVEHKGLYRFLKKHDVNYGIYSQDTKKEYIRFNDIIKSKLLKDFQDKKQQIIKWCDKSYINSNIFCEFINKYIDGYYSIVCLHDDLEIFDNLIIPFDKDDNTHVNVINSFYYGSVGKMVMLDRMPYITSLKTINEIVTYRNKTQKKENIIYEMLSNVNTNIVSLMTCGFFLNNNLFKKSITTSYINGLDPTNLHKLLETSDPVFTMIYEGILTGIREYLHSKYSHIGGNKKSKLLKVKTDMILNDKSLLKKIKNSVFLENDSKTKTNKRIKELYRNNKFYIHTDMSSLLGLYGVIFENNNIQLVPYYSKNYNDMFNVMEMLREKYGKIQINIRL